MTDVCFDVVSDFSAVLLRYAVNWLVKWQKHFKTNLLTDWLAYCVTGLLTDLMTDWLTGLLSQWLGVRTMDPQMYPLGDARRY